MPKVRVAFIAEILFEDFDGAARTMFQLIKRIPRNDFEFLFICGSGNIETYGYDVLYVPSVTLPLNSTYKMVLPALAKGKLLKKLDAFAPNVIHIATPSPLGSFGVKYAGKRGLPVISIYHTHFISYVDYYLKRLPFLINTVKGFVADSQRKFYNRCNIIYVPSRSMYNALHEIGVEPQRMVMWKRGIDTTLFTPEKRNLAMMQQLTGNTLPVVLFASRLVWEKNLETFIRLYELAKEKALPVNFVVAGDGVARKDCEERMPEAIFLGTLAHQQLSEVYASSDVFVFPSISETYGNVVMEAMASGICCIVADGGGSRDFIEQGVNGFKCEPNNAADYLQRIEQLLGDEALSVQMSAAGRQYSFSGDWQQLAARYFQDLQSLAAAGKTGNPIKA